MRYGVYLPNFGAFGDVGTLVDCARDAERAGWDGFFIWDHINRAWLTEVVDPCIALAAVATATTRIRLGALVTPLPRRRPWKVARETTTLDRLSGGRLIFGAGLGSQGGTSAEWEGFGEEASLVVRAQMLDEGLEILDGLWRGEPFSHGASGSTHYRVDLTQFSPTPLQRPRIPVWLAGYWPSRTRLPFRRAARWDGAFALRRDGAMSADDVRELAAYLHEEREKVHENRVKVQGERDGARHEDENASAADRPFDIVHLSAPTPGDDPDAAAARVAPYVEAGATWWLERITPDEFDGNWQGEWPLDAMRERVRQGPPQSV